MDTNEAHTSIGDKAVAAIDAGDTDKDKAKETLTHEQTAEDSSFSKEEHDPSPSNTCYQPVADRFPREASIGHDDESADDDSQQGKLFIVEEEEATTSEFPFKKEETPESDEAQTSRAHHDYYYTEPKETIKMEEEDEEQWEQCVIDEYEDLNEEMDENDDALALELGISPTELLERTRLKRHLMRMRGEEIFYENSDEEDDDEDFYRLSDKCPSFNWTTYLTRNGGLPISDSNLFSHVNRMEQTVTEKFFPRGCEVVFKGKRALVESTVGTMLFIRLLENSKREFVSIDQISIKEKNIRCHTRSREEMKKYPIMDTYYEYADKRLYDLLKRGDWFEYQDERNPSLVWLSCVLSHRGGGLVEFVIPSERNQIRFVHFGSPFVHDIGWSSAHPQVECANAQHYPMAREYQCPQVLFNYIVPKHNLKKGSLVEVLSTEAHREVTFYPGVVESVFDGWAVVDVLSPSFEQKIISISSGEIVPVGFCERHGIRLLFPRSLFRPEDDSPDLKWRYAQIILSSEHERAILEAEGDPVAEERENYDYVFTSDRDIPYPRMDGKSREGYLAVMFRSRTFGVYMVPAYVSRSIGHIVSVTLDPFCDILPPRFLSIRSDSLFPPSFSDVHSIPVRVPLLLDIPSPPEHFSSSATKVFTPSEGYKFVPKYTIEADQWLPTIYVNKGCCVGPLDFEKVRLLPEVIPEGSMYPTIRCIVKLIDQLGTFCYLQLVISRATNPQKTQILMLLKCATSEELVIEKLNPPLDIVSSQLNTVFCKKSGYLNIMKLYCCEWATQFPYWMKRTLLRVGCCPNLFSLERLDGPCVYMCGMREGVDAVEQLQLEHIQQIGEMNLRTMLAMSDNTHRAFIHAMWTVRYRALKKKQRKKKWIKQQIKLARSLYRQPPEESPIEQKKKKKGKRRSKEARIRTSDNHATLEVKVKKTRKKRMLREVELKRRGRPRTITSKERDIIQRVFNGTEDGQEGQEVEQQEGNNEQEEMPVFDEDQPDRECSEPSSSAVPEVSVPSSSALLGVSISPSSALPGVFIPSSSALPEVSIPSSSALPGISIPSSSALPEVSIPSSSALPGVSVSSSPSHPPSSPIRRIAASLPLLSPIGVFPPQNPDDTLTLPSDPFEWDTMELSRFLRETFGMGEIVDLLEEHDIDGIKLFQLDESSCAGDLGLRYGKTLILLNAIGAMRKARQRLTQ